jgi:hypothetical protein
MMGAMSVITGPVTFPGEFTPLSGTTEAARPELAGLVLYDTIAEIILFAFGPGVPVQIQLRVVTAGRILGNCCYRIMMRRSPR